MAGYSTQTQQDADISECAAKIRQLASTDEQIDQHQKTLVNLGKRREELAKEIDARRAALASSTPYVAPVVIKPE